MQKLIVNGKKLDLGTPKVMGILNITPDSFFDGGIYRSEKKILERAEQILSEDGSIIDAGGFSTRPGAAYVEEKEERRRIIPAIRSMRKEFPGAIISIDTFRASVAREAIAEGVDIINDVSGGSLDTEMIPLVGKSKTSFVIMHMKGSIGKMPKHPHYKNIVKEVRSFFKLQIKKFPKKSGLILDPGFGFGKSLAHNYRLLNGLEHFKDLKLPLLVGISRKSIVNGVLGTSPEHALNGTTALHMIALAKGADILRVHDVKEAVQAIKIHTFAQSNPSQ